MNEQTTLKQIGYQYARRFAIKTAIGLVVLFVLSIIGWSLGDKKQDVPSTDSSEPSTDQVVHSFSAPDDGFSLAFPKTPAVETKHFDHPEYGSTETKQYGTSVDGHVYILTSRRMQKVQYDEQTDRSKLMVFLDTMVKSLAPVGTHYEILLNQPTSKEGHPARHFKINLEQEWLEGFFVYKNRVLYTYMVTSSISKPLSATETDAFLSSFRFLP